MKKDDLLSADAAVEREEKGPELFTGEKVEGMAWMTFTGRPSRKRGSSSGFESVMFEHGDGFLRDDAVKGCAAERREGRGEIPWEVGK